jgi:hypothetical protein
MTRNTIFNSRGGSAVRTDKKPFDQKVKDENVTTWLSPRLVGEVKSNAL